MTCHEITATHRHLSATPTRQVAGFLLATVSSMAHRLKLWLSIQESCPGAAPRLDHCLYECCQSYPGHYRDRNRDQYLTRYQYQYPVRHCARRQTCCLRHDPERRGDRDIVSRCSSSGAAHLRPGFLRGRPMDFHQRRMHDVTWAMVQCGAASRDANLGNNRATQGGPYCAPCRCCHPLGCMAVHIAFRAGSYVQASRHHRLTRYCQRRPGPRS